MPYIANTDEDRREMLETIGLESMEALWESACVGNSPVSIDLPSGLSEFEVTRKLAGIAHKNRNDLTCFLGCGFYDHFIPAAVGDVIGRTEFLTSYTPYQPEASQGTLQAIYEYQSHICRLTGMDAANASMYDGGTALFEAMMMAIRTQRKRKHAIVAGTISPIYRDMIRCYCANLDVEVQIQDLPDTGTVTDLEDLKTMITDDTAVILVQYPNVFGSVEDWSDLVEFAHEKGVFCVACSYPTALSVATSPGDMGFDVVCGEGQALGINLNFGGPYLGYIACKGKKLLRNMPGRICGRTKDVDGKEGFVLTLQAREQHIRREKATSNICTNEGLCAVAATVYLSCIGKEGFVHLGKLCTSKAGYLRAAVGALPGVTLPEQTAYFNEFIVTLPDDAATVAGKMVKKGFAAGFPMGRYYPKRPNDLLVAVTEKRTKEEMDTYVKALSECLKSN